jgi:hypothetical protein
MLFNNANSIIEIYWKKRSQPRRPGFCSMSGLIGFTMNKIALGQFYPSSSVSPAKSHSVNSSVFIFQRLRYIISLLALSLNNIL